MTNSDDPAWREYFGFEEPYETQRDAIETAIEVGEDGGYLAMEGPCGTGKTMAALTAVATLVRHGAYDNAVVVTPVKQQRQQFVEDLRTLNADLDRPLDGVALVGKRDLCPYGREGVFPDDAGVQDRCEELRETTATLVEGEAGETEPVAEAAVGADTGDIWWDPQTASDLATAARPGGAGQHQPGNRLETAGASSPYQRSRPAAPDTPTGGDDRLYCPFEADWYARNTGSPVGFEAGEENVVTAEDYLSGATARGTCPHRAMGALLEAAEVVVGNYNHLFDPNSRPLVESILDDRSFLVVDEAHRLEERVRELLSERVGRQTLKRARNDLATVLSRARESDDNRAAVEERLASREIPLSALAEVRAFYDDLVEWLDGRVEAFLDGELGQGWHTGGDLPERDLEIPLRDPETVERDDLTEWAESQGYTGDHWRRLGAVGGAVESVIDALGVARTPVCAAVGVHMEQWWNAGHARYLREVELDHAPTNRDGWQGTYTARLVLFECMPGQTLREVFDELGGGILMSATLEPLDVFTEVSGLAALAEERPVVERTYELAFPAENRASWVVDATRFTARNRGDPGEQSDPDTWNRTRDEYAHVLRELARSPGNVLLALPNYREARWAGDYLADAVEKPVLVDASTSFDETERLKREFFAGGGKLLVTSARGTLTEGVDYDGDKLGCCAVVGVPLVSVGSARVRAVRRAYADAFGEDSAFEYALTVPAVRRARQTVGRVIRGTDEVGIRAFVGRRYVSGARHSVHPYLSSGERDEFVRTTPEFLSEQVDQFWAARDGS
jgi:DNA excision repair protein ERCC-2